MRNRQPTATATAMSGFRVVVCGGGIAAVEGLLRLRRLVGSSVDIDVVAPNDELVIRPLAVRQPFAFGPPSRYELGRIVTDNDADWHRDTLAWVDREARKGKGASDHAPLVADLDL